MSEMGRGAPAQSATADREIVISRVINAPRELVFEAFTELRHLSRWWGPEGFATTTRAFEFRVGGEWVFVMHGPDGTDYQEWISWTEIGRASCRERVYISVVAVSLKKKILSIYYNLFW